MLFVVLAAGTASAQDASTLPLRSEAVDATGYPEVSMVVSVPLEMVGKNLTSDNFIVTEGGEVRPSTATSVPTDGLQVVLLLDASGSMGGEPIVAARQAAQDFIDTMPAGVEVAVVSFAEEPIVLSPFTTDQEETSSAIANIQLGKNTALYDGLIAGAGVFDGQGGTRRTLVLLSDGGDTASVASLDEAIVSLLDAELAFYAVELQSPEYDAEALARLGAATDGLVVAAEDPDGLTAVFVDVASQIVNRYEVSYVSEAYGRTVVAVNAEVDGISASTSQGVLFPDPPTTTNASANDSSSGDIAEVEPTSVALRSGSIVVVNWAQSSWALWVGALVVFAALVALLLFTGLGQPKERRAKLVDSKSSFGHSKGKTLASLADSATLLAERTVNRGEAGTGRVTVLLEKAGIQLRPGEFVVLSISVAIVVMAIAVVFASPWVVLLSGVGTLLVIRLWVGRRVTKRQEAFSDQLINVLLMMAGSIRTGFGLMQAMDTVATEIPAPAGEEFQRVKIEIQLGRDVDEALLAMAARVESEDFKWIVEAIEIHREVGGDLAEILDSVMETVRDRIRVRRRIHALSAEGRVSALILGLLPFAMAFFMYLINPEYMAELTTTTIGRFLIVGGILLIGIGLLWMRRITTLKF
ncbi:MAG: type II secretion system F family protein [Actinomycetia bacterium]|nr:type II secretion system F family protein [Actinomycetes bacterium]